MDEFKATMARQVAKAAIDLHQQKTGRVPRGGPAVLSGVRLAVAPHHGFYATRSASMES